MTTVVKLKSADIANLIKGNPAAPVSSLPPVWQNIAYGGGNTGLTEQERQDYVEAAQLFRHYNTPLCMEALSIIGKSFDKKAYPDFKFAISQAKTSLAKKTIAGAQALFLEFGYSIPSAFYNVIVHTALQENQDEMMLLFRDDDKIMQHRLQDAVLHGVLLVTPVSLRMHSVMSQHGVQFIHLMECGCKSITAAAAFDVPLDASLKPAYLQNMLAAAFEQYGVNIPTSGKIRGF